MTKDEIVFGGNRMTILVERCLYWSSQQMLIISDVHLGKSDHFRKAGIAFSQGVELGDLEKIEKLIIEYQPQTVIFLGDLFHSQHNIQWDIFAQWIKKFTTQFILIEGNHDLLTPNMYKQVNITCIEELTIQNICFTHEPIENGNRFNICGHIHPGIRLVGKANQSVRLPCFWIKKNQIVLPAFGSLTGLYIVEPRKDELVFGIAKTTLYRYGQ